MANWIDRFPAVILIAILSWCATAAPASAADDAATLSVINPAPEINGVKIKHITVTLDSYGFGDCWLDRPLKDAICIEAREIEAGPHKVELILDPLKQSFFRASVAFTSGVRGDWVLDVRKMVIAGARQDDYLVMQGKLAPVEGCVPALERIAALSSCKSDGLKDVAEAFIEASGGCRSVAPAERDAVAGALVGAFDVHFGLRLEQCYEARQIERLPGRITERWIGRDSDMWPPGSIDASSWQWARDVLPKKWRADEAMDALDVALKALPTLAARFEVVDSVIRAYLGGDAQPVLRAARQQPWTLDPATPEGHRNVLVLTDPKFFYDDAHADFVAAKVAADPSLDCARSRWQVEHLLDYFTAHETLSPSAWRAVAAMMARVPPDGSYDACRIALDPRRPSPVSVSERLHLVVQLDCAASRPKEMRGGWLKQIVAKGSDRMAGVDFDLRDQLRTEFAACLDSN